MGKWEWNAPKWKWQSIYLANFWANGGIITDILILLIILVGTPRNLSSTLDQFCDKVLLNWNLGANQTPNNRRFKVYRKELPNGNYSLLNVKCNGQ